MACRVLVAMIMSPRFAILALCVAWMASGQTVDQQSATPKPQDQTKQDSAIQVEPGPPAIKQKDIWNETGIFHPFVRMPRYILQDQKAIWTSPIHTVKADVKYWVIFGAATAALVATDRWTVKQLPNSSSQVSVSTWGSRVGSAYSLIPITAAFYFIGSAHPQGAVPRNRTAWF